MYIIHLRAAYNLQRTHAIEALKDVLNLESNWRLRVHLCMRESEREEWEGEGDKESDERERAR